MTSIFNQRYNEPSGCFGLFRSGETSDGKSSVQIPLLLNNQRIRSPNEHGIEAEDRKRKQELDNMLSEAMSGLSFQERERQQEILHGVDETVTEDKDFLERVLKELDHQLLCTSTKHGSAYEIAERMDAAYVNARAFRLMFLRANEYDPKASAAQMFRFFESKYELFGPDKLVKDITIEDLGKEEIALLEADYFHLTGRDASGRDVFFYSAIACASTNLRKEVFLRAHFYLIMKSLQSEDTQLRGTISIWYCIGEWTSETKFVRSRFGEFFKASRVALPQKKSAIHICVENMHTAAVFHTIIKIMQGLLRARVRLHCGSHMECQYQLSTYGIPTEVIPVDENGSLKSYRYRSWVQPSTFHAAPDDHQSLSLSNQADCIQSSPNDVLFTGAKVGYSDGNQLFISLIHDYSSVYDDASNKVKAEIVDQIVGKIHSSGGRFLKLQTGSLSLWEEVQTAELRKKVAQSFRNYRRRHTRRKTKGSSPA